MGIDSEIFRAASAMVSLRLSARAPTALPISQDNFVAIFEEAYSNLLAAAVKLQNTQGMSPHLPWNKQG